MRSESGEIDLSRLSRVLVFPVRHHSPRTSAALRALLEQEQPALVLIEGPEDASGLIELIADPETEPPIAILGYRKGGAAGSTLWPLAAYSPEYVALAWAISNQKKAAFIDVSSGVALAYQSQEYFDEAHDDPGSFEMDEPDEALASSFDVQRASAEALGYRSFEELWEAVFEAPAFEPEAFRRVLLAYADLVRETDRREAHRARDAHMAKRVLEAMDAGVDPSEILVVVGAAHAAALCAGEVDFSLLARLPRAVESAVTLIPFSFPRLASHIGYGAGNRAPQYYQRAHDAGCDYRRATLEVLCELADALRLRGFSVSLADVIEAYRLSLSLADLRGKAEPGLDELREATIATLTRGEATHVDGLLFRSVIGHRVGKVAARVGQCSLQEEFWTRLRAFRLPESDALESFTLALTDPVQAEASVFLHRLRIARIPYANLSKEQPSALAALKQVREGWQAQWTPATDVALVDKIVLGTSLEEVVSRIFEEQLEAASRTADAASVLLEAVLTRCARTTATALELCDRFASDDDDLPSLARSASVLAALVSFGRARVQKEGGEATLRALFQKTFARAVLRVRAACVGSAEAVEKPREALLVLHDVALKQGAQDREAWFVAARELVQSYAVHPSCSGLAAGLLYLVSVIGEEDMARLIQERLSTSFDPGGAASFLEGFLQANPLALVKSRPVVAALDAFLTGLEPARFRDALPILRRALSRLGATERRYLLENVLALRGLGARAAEAQAILEERDRDKLKAMSAELSKDLDDLDELL